MPAVYSIADIIISSSIEPEAFGRISAEASSMTKPIIASNHGGSREIIENEITGWLVEPSNPLKKISRKNPSSAPTSSRKKRWYWIKRKKKSSRKV